ncbi:hypothetical protein NQ318_020414 [Aromia moschata]|uniref:Carboxylesterase type B domain-containing protein n=1 Tax=Aromia moschata TaxID=1265417 RepID=A0AAV8YJ85_9CUCU|nr:hypothetical protein NQ318_020414 [Aromia moschata]
MENGLNSLSLIWGPIIEDENLDNALIVGPMEYNMEVGNMNQIPTLIGFNSEELVYFLRGVPDVSVFLAPLGSYFDEDTSRLINNKFNMTAENKVKAGEELRRIYTETSFEEDVSALVRFLSDQSYSTPSARQAVLQSKYTYVYLYQFSYSGLIGGNTVHIEGADNVGHTEELMNPTPTKDELLDNVIWEKASPDNVTYLSINVTLEMKTNVKRYKEFVPNL